MKLKAHDYSVRSHHLASGLHNEGFRHGFMDAVCATYVHIAYSAILYLLVRYASVPPIHG
ncbi:hypothetical protein J6590_053108 [Homalodisca vitripennis]|nr:hypothetical protein J6590_053108 [Homalodisca vitripennis]